MKYPHWATVERKVSSNAYGDPSYDAPERLRCRVSSNAEEIRTLGGEVVTSNVKVSFPGDPDIDYDDQVTLPDNTQPPIVGIRKPTAVLGRVHHTELLF